MSTDTSVAPRVPRLLAPVLLVESVPLLAVGGLDVVGAATSPETWASGLIWLLAGLLALGLAVRTVRSKSTKDGWRLWWWIALVQVAVATLLYYGHQVESASHRDRWSVPLLAALAVPVAVGVLGVLRGWRAARALGERPFPLGETRLQAMVGVLGVLGSASVVVIEQVYLPNHDIPTVNVEATIVELGRSGDDVFLQGTIALTNAGAAPASVLGSLYRVTGHRFGTATARPDPDDVRSAIDGAGINVHRYPQPGNDVSAARLVQADDVLGLSEFLMPGETIRRGFTVRGSAAQEEYVRLEADVIVMTGRLDEPAVRCPRQADRSNPNQTGYTSVCWQTRMPSRNSVHRWFDDGLAVQSVVVVSNPNAGPVLFPYLYAAFAAGDAEPVAARDALWQRNFISQVSARTEYAYTRPVATSA